MKKKPFALIRLFFSYARHAAFLVCIIFIGLHAQSNFIPLYGILPPTVKNQGTPYIVTDSCKVPEGAFTVIESGVVFLFKNFTGIYVSGVIRVEGSEDKPVVFTSENDSLYNTASTIEPAAFDWDGIVIGPGDAENVFEYCHISYSLFGINCNGSNISLKNCTFIENGNANLTIAGVNQEVTSPFSFQPEKKSPGLFDEASAKPETTTAETDLYGPTVSSDSPEPEIEEDKTGRKSVSLVHEPSPPPKKRHIGLRLLSLAAVGVGGAMGARETRLYLENKKAFDELNATDEKWNTQKDVVDQHLAYMISFYGIALIGATVFTITFAF